MSSVEEGTFERVPDGHASKLEKEVRANVEAQDEIGDACELDGNLIQKKEPLDMIGEGKDDSTVGAQSGEIDEVVDRGFLNESSPIPLVETKVGDDDSQPERNGEAGEIEQQKLHDGSNAEDSTDREANTSSGQGNLLNGILSLVGLGSSKPVASEDGNADSTGVLDETDHGGKGEGVSEARKESKELESGEFEVAEESKDAGLDDFELLDVKSGDSIDDHEQSISTQASEPEVSLEDTSSRKLVGSEVVDDHSAMSDREWEKPADAAEVGETGDGQHKSDDAGNAGDKATAAVEGSKTEAIAPAGKTGLLELVGGGVLSLIGLGGAKHAADSPGENGNEHGVNEEIQQASLNGSEADMEMSKDETTFELVNNPLEEDLKSEGITGMGAFLVDVDAAKDDATSKGKVAVGETPEPNSDVLSSLNTNGVDEEISSVVLNSGAHSDKEISGKESVDGNWNEVDTQEDDEEPKVATDYLAGDPRRMKAGIDSKGSDTAEKAVQKDVEDSHCSQADNAEAGEAGQEFSNKSYGTEKNYSIASGRPNHPNVAAVDTNETSGPEEAEIAALTDFDESGADKAIPQEEHGRRKPISGDNDILKASETMPQNPKMNDEEKGPQNDSDALDIEQNDLPSEADSVQGAAEEVGIHSGRRIPANTNSSETIHAKPFPAEQDESLGSETVKEESAAAEAYEIADASNAEGTESRSTQDPTSDGAAEVTEEQETKDSELNGHVENSQEWLDGVDHGTVTDNLRQRSPFMNEAVPKAASQLASNLYNLPESQQKVDRSLDDEQSLSNDSTMPDQEPPAINRSDSRTRSIFGITLKHVEPTTRTPTGEMGSDAKHEFSLGKGIDRTEDSPTSRNHVSDSSNRVEPASPITKDESAALVNGFAAHGGEIHPKVLDEYQEDGMKAAQRQQLELDSSNDEPNETGTIVSENASQERNFEPTPFSTVKETKEAVDPSVPQTDDTAAQRDLATKADTTSGGSNMFSEEVPSAKENAVEVQARTSSSEFANHADVRIYAPKQEDGLAFGDAPSTTAQSLNESRSTTPPETPFTQRPEHLEQKHPPSPADDLSASQSPIEGILPVGVQMRVWSTPGEQSRETTGNTGASEHVEATNAFVRQTTSEKNETCPAPTEKERSIPTAAKPTVKRSRSKSGVAKLKVCFTGCSGVEN